MPRQDTYGQLTPQSGVKFTGRSASATGEIDFDDFMNTILALARDSRITVLNGAGATIGKGKPVSFGGFSTVSNTPIVILADADGTGTMPVIGVAAADIAANGLGDIIFDGAVTGTATANLNTSAWTEGDVLYASTTPGVYVNAPNTAAWVQAVATVTRSHATLGQLLVRVRAPSKAIAGLAARGTVTGAELMATDNDEKLSVDQIAAYVKTRQPTIADATAARTLALTDAGAHLRMTNATAATVTIPLNASVAFPLDTVILISADGAGTITIQGANGTTLNGVAANGTTVGKTTVSTAWRGVVALQKVGTDAWAVRGDCSAVA